MKTLQQATTSMDTTRRSILYHLLKERYKDRGVTEEYLQQEVQFYIEQIETGTPILQPKPQSGIINADPINQEFQEYEIDIHSLYQQLNHIGQRINQHQKLNESILNDIRVKIRKTEERLREQEQVLRDRSAHAVFFETFIDSNSVEKDASFYTDREGIPIPLAYRATLDVSQHALKLPTTYTENAIINFSGLKLAKINIKKQLGSGFIRSKNPEHSVEKAFDTSMESFWSESILTDAPLEVDLGIDYYGINFGAACELEIVFDYIAHINEITLSPFTEYPIEVVAIHVFTTDREEEAPFIIASPNHKMGSKESTDVISYQFPDVVCKRLRLLINQKHYVKRDMIMEVEDKSILDAWLANQGHFEVPSYKLFQPIYLDQNQQKPHWFHFTDYLNKRNLLEEIEKWQQEEKPQTVLMSKYEYQYGFYNIAVNRNEYHHTGVYVTHPITKGNIHRAYLETVEEHPLLPGLTIPATHIEYYLTDKEQPSTEDWHGILPKNVEVVESEPLIVQFNGSAYQGRSRFVIKKLLAIRENGIALQSSVDYILVGRIVTIQNYRPSSVYTLDYVPEESAYYVDFLKLYMKGDQIVPQMTMDQFNGISTKGDVTLSRHPFVDKERLNAQGLPYHPTYLSNDYLPITVVVTLPDGTRLEQPVNVHDDSIGIINRTDYFNPDVSLLEPFDPVLNNYQYRVVGNQIKFNAMFPEGTLIVVRYPFLTGPIRLKAILKRNLHDVDGLTPFLHEYKTVFQSLT